MKVVIVGAGALGSLYAAYLRRPATAASASDLCGDLHAQPLGEARDAAPLPVRARIHRVVRMHRHALARWFAAHGVPLSPANFALTFEPARLTTAFHHDVQGTLLRELTVLRLEDTRLPALR